MIVFNDTSEETVIPFQRERSSISLRYHSYPEILYNTRQVSMHINSKIIFLDVDGTLVDYEGKLPDSAFHALRKAVEYGRKVILVPEDLKQKSMTVKDGKTLLTGFMNIIWDSLWNPIQVYMLQNTSKKHVIL